MDFFLKYLRQDSIGRMSNAHLIMADVKGLFQSVLFIFLILLHYALI